MVTAFILVLFLTRVGWIYVPVPLFAYFILVATRHGGVTPRLLLHILASIVLLYTVLGGEGVEASPKESPVRV